jgi:hypothetical protein
MGLPTDSPDCADRNIQPCGAQVDTSSGSAESGQFGDVKHISNGF